MFAVLLLAYASALATTMGAHRLYTHRTFKANKWIRLALVTFQTVAGQVYMMILFIKTDLGLAGNLSSKQFRKTFSELLMGLDQRSQAAPQVQRHRCRST